MDLKITIELKAIETFTQIADKSNSEGKKGKSLLLEVAKDKEILNIIGNIEYIPKLANDDNQENEKYYQSLSPNQIEVVNAYYKLFHKMSKYSNGEGSEAKRDKKFAAFIKTYHEPTELNN